jgi:hypothetical protein
MGEKPESFDAVAFKDEMQRRAERELEGLPPEERRRRISEAALAGRLSKWREGLRPAAEDGRR